MYQLRPLYKKTYSEYQTFLVFEWSKVVWLTNGYKCLGIHMALWKPNKKFEFQMFSLNTWVNWLKNYLNTTKQIFIWYSDKSGIWVLRFWTLTVFLFTTFPLGYGSPKGKIIWKTFSGVFILCPIFEFWRTFSGNWLC